jgi:hypothetical protein
MFVKLILVAAAAAFVALFGGTDAWARGSKGGHWGGKNSKSMHGMHGKPGHHFPRQAHHSHGWSWTRSSPRAGCLAQVIRQVVGLPQEPAGRQFWRWQLRGRRLRRERRGCLYKLAVLPGRLVSGELRKPLISVVGNLPEKWARRRQVSSAMITEFQVFSIQTGNT